MIYVYIFFKVFGMTQPGVVYQHTNTSGNIIKHNLQTSMNERTHFFIKIYLSHFILERVDVFVVCERWVERHMLRAGTSSFSHIFFQEPGGQCLHRLASSSESLLIGCVSLARPRFSALCPNLTAWLWSRDPLLVTHLFDLSALTHRHLPVY